LIVIYCANVSGKIVPYEKIKVKKNLTSVKLFNHDGISKEIENKLIENVDVESIQLLYKNAIKSASEFTTKESAINWFLKKQQEIVDINHLIKIDNVLIHVI
jgi:anaerobic ribonucleoside-triphosphate reductase